MDPKNTKNTPKSTQKYPQNVLKNPNYLAIDKDIVAFDIAVHDRLGQIVQVSTYKIHV
jgi:hypothetical protein